MSRNRCYRSTSFRPFIEVLEDRSLLSTYTVDRLADLGQGSGLTGDLRYCLTQATSKQETMDTIGFSVTGTINLSAPLPTLSHRNLTITGPGSGSLTVKRNSSSTFRIFTVPAFAVVGMSAFIRISGL